MDQKQVEPHFPQGHLGRTPSSVFSTPENQSTQQLRLRRTGLISDRFQLLDPRCTAVTNPCSTSNDPVNSIE
jgi:hypothetical protein